MPLRLVKGIVFLLLLLLVLGIVSLVKGQDLWKNNNTATVNRELESVKDDDLLNSLWGEGYAASQEITVKKLAEAMLAEHLKRNKKLTYENYEYYRSYINDTSDRIMLKAFSEGLIPLVF
ncbi:hypothetical protein SAMN02745221_01962 [Thermosyntropha lipolytica DSM 11003]|uniref:Uncharacterized protein n=1 Tax=Thermosyntropha lipolytica DSM 11003 TaxID=1123382 RepID=A0A1M5R8F9_9FIRM|nr:hypothetical protein [Thermosyntropha lipolytica]SHH22316.1 hypothetical protein SAMN02745221_01962 [Thermosyntropha lipolytica DSM 11003]